VAGTELSEKEEIQMAKLFKRRFQSDSTGTSQISPVEGATAS
jgi:hypothetical protein